MTARTRWLSLLAVLGAVVAVVVSTAAARSGTAKHRAAPTHHATQTIAWHDCGDGYQCGNLEVPFDYRHSNGRQFNLALIRLPAQDQAHRIGPLFVNFGGPGGTAVDTIHAIGSALFGAVNDRFDIVGFDPRGVGESQPSVDCQANQETEGIYSQPYTTPFNLDVHALLAKDRGYIRRCKQLNGSVLNYITTGNTARDMDRIRAAMGDAKLNYLGFSYGTFLGSTYASLFPNRYRAMVLDGPLDMQAYIDKPTENLQEQSQGFERALARFFQACAADQGTCGFGGSDPADAYEQLVQHAYTHPLPASGSDPRPVGGDDLIAGAMLAMYAKQLWPLLVEALQEAQNGDGTTFRVLADAFYGRNDDGTFSPGTDRYFLITAADQSYEPGIRAYLDSGNHSWGLFDHAWWNTGYVELNYGLYQPNSNGVYGGPFRANRSAPTMLEVATTYDPATPYKGALRTEAQLGNVRLLTMRGDGHTAYGGNSACIDDAVNLYIETLALPAEGTVCQQEVPFAQTARAASHSLRSVLDLHVRVGPHGVG